MSLETQINDLATTIATDLNGVDSRAGNLASLQTVDKASLVAAINEVLAAVGSGGSITADSITDATTVGKALIRAVNAAAARSAIGAGTSNLVVGTGATDAKAGNYQPAAADISNATTIGRGILTSVDAAAVRVLLSVMSSAETNSAITTAVANVVGGAGAAYDTLVELQGILQADDSAIGNLTTLIGQRVATTAGQGLDATAKQNARDNIDVYSKTQIGSVTADFVATYNAARA
jgi:hypothetical protein